MRRRTLIGQMLAITTLAGIALTTLLIAQTSRPPNLGSPDTKPVAPHVAEEATHTVTRYGLPMRLKIPKINVDAPIDQMGLTPDGDMQAPSGLQNVGWYKLGSRPGDAGSAVIAGHFGRSRTGELPVFEQLHTLDAGDFIHVEDEKGQIATFVVREHRTFGQNEATPDVFGSTDGKAHLNLVTCKGAWDSAQQTYSDRLVVFSDKE